MNANESNRDQQYDEVKHEIAQAVDSSLGEGTAEMAEGTVDRTIGYAEARAGSAFGNKDVEREGAKRALHGTAEQVGANLTQDIAPSVSQIEQDVAALQAEMSNLQAQHAAATGEAKAKVQSQIDATRAKAQATHDRINAAIDQANQQADARIASLKQQAAQATGEAKTKIQDQIDQIHYENQQFANSLNKSLQDNTTVLSR